MTVIAISGSPFPHSRTQRLLSHVLSLIARRGLDTPAYARANEACIEAAAPATT